MTPPVVRIVRSFWRGGPARVALGVALAFALAVGVVAVLRPLACGNAAHVVALGALAGGRAVADPSGLGPQGRSLGADPLPWLRCGPASAAAPRLAAVALLDHGDAPGARALLEPAVQDHPGDRVAWLFLGEARAASGDDAGAAAAWRAAEAAQFYRNRSEALDLRGRYEEALAVAERAIVLSPDWAWGWVRVGEARERLSRAVGGVAAYAEAERRATTLAPLERAQLERDRARLLMRRAGDLDGAADAIAAAEAAAPGHRDNRLLRGELLQRRGDYAGALDLFAAAERASPLDPYPALHAAEVYQLQGDIPAARAALKRAIAIAPQEPVAYEHLADFLTGLSDPHAEELRAEAAARRAAAARDWLPTRARDAVP